MRFASLLACVGGGIASVTYLRIRRDGRRDGVRPATAILLFGASAGSLALRVRTKRAADLYAQGLAPVVVCAGTPDETAWMFAALAGHGVPAPALAVAPADSTRESVAVAYERLGGERTAIAVTSYYHMHRVLDEARRTGLQVVGSPTPPAGRPRSLRGWAHAHRSIAREVAAVWFYRLAPS
jgi:uncharacterized SAM-binding protein YcdF (DUF218 family)